MSVLPNAAMIDAHLNLGAKHESLQQLAIKYDGACTKKFSQGSDDRQAGLGFWYHGRLTGGQRWGGVCKALSVFWITAHANDQDFWGWLMDGGSWTHIERARAIIDVHGWYKNRGGQTQDAWTNERLESVGLEERRAIAGGGSMQRTGAATAISATGSRYLAGFMMASDLAPNFDKTTEGYRQLSFWGPPGGGHAVAAWVAEDVAFFDPNYGEFWFPSPAKFRQWYGHFWNMTGYGDRYPRLYKINQYGKTA